MSRCLLRSSVCLVVLVCGLVLVFDQSASAAEKHPLKVGWGKADITPPEKVAVVGQLRKRISEGAQDPLTVTALALETQSKEGESVEQAIMISCDLCFIRQVTLNEVRQAVAQRLPEFDSRKLLMNATHTHTAPQQVDNSFKGLYDVSQDEGVWKPSQYRKLLVQRVAEAAVKAWESRKSGSFTWGLGEAVVGRNRRAVYFDGHTQMYGNTGKPDFDRLEGFEDHSLPLLFFWDESKKLTGILVNLPCPSQETEGINQLSADFWHDVRVELSKRFSEDLFLLPQCSAAGDISPHHMLRKPIEAVMLKRRGLTSRQYIARKIVDAIEEVLALSQEGYEDEVTFKHLVEQIPLPAPEGVEAPFYETDDPNQIDTHIIRLGEIAFATNPYELYQDYGHRMQSRSPAIMTLTVQLSGGVSGYLPTREAVQRGGYSAVKFIVGPEGGDVLVDETVRLIQSLWK